MSGRRWAGVYNHRRPTWMGATGTGPSLSATCLTAHRGRLGATGDRWRRRLGRGEHGLAVTAVESAEIDPEQLIVRPAREEIERVAALSMGARSEVFARAGSVSARTGEVKRTGTLRLDEAWRADVKLADATLGTTKNGTHARSSITLDEHFWRVVGLYIAEGCTVADGQRRRIQWSFHPTTEQHLVDEIVAFWLGTTCAQA